jgi:hypothetical protein
MFCRYPPITEQLQFHERWHNCKNLFPLLHVLYTRLKNNLLSLIPNILTLRITYAIGLAQKNNFILL